MPGSLTFREPLSNPPSPTREEPLTQITTHLIVETLISIRKEGRTLILLTTYLYGIKGLDLTYTQLTQKDIENLCQALKTNTTLQALWLDNNHISPETAKTIANLLCVNHTLQLLSLNDNNLGFVLFYLNLRRLSNI